MEKVSVTVQYDEEKLETIKICLGKKGIDIGDEIVKFIDSLYNKNVPSQVREFFELKRSAETGCASKSNPKNKPRSDVNEKQQ